MLFFRRMAPTLLQSPIQWPVTTVAGQQYQCKFSFAAARRIAATQIDVHFPMPQLTETSSEEERRAAAPTIIQRNLIIASCTLGREVQGRWQTIGMDAAQIEEMLLPGEYATMVAAISEANRLAEEAQKKTAAQPAPPTTTEPSPSIQ